MAPKASLSRVAAFASHRKDVKRSKILDSGTQVKIKTNGGLFNGDFFRKLEEEFGRTVQAVDTNTASIYIK